MTLVSAEGGVGSGSVTYRVQPTPGSNSRFGVISIGGHRMMVRQVEGRIGTFTGGFLPRTDELPVRIDRSQVDSSVNRIPGISEQPGSDSAVAVLPYDIADAVLIQIDR